MSLTFREMIEIMGGDRKAEPFRMYVDNTIRAFLAVRKYREQIINLVELLTKSSLGCFNKNSIEVTYILLIVAPKKVPRR